VNGHHRIPVIQVWVPKVASPHATCEYSWIRLADDAAASGDTTVAVSYCEQMVAPAEEAFGSGTSG